MKSKKKVLIIAYACEPNRSSEPGVGWNFVKEISSFMDVTVLTRANNRSSIELKENTGINFIYYDLLPSLQRIKKKIPFGLQLYYFLWQIFAYKKVEEIVKNENFDLLHHLTFGVTKNMPPVQHFNIPFVLGPAGGGDVIPFSFLKKMGPKAIVNEAIYKLLHLKSYYLSINTYHAKRKLSAIIFRTSSSMDNFPMRNKYKSHLISESAFTFDPDYEYSKSNSEIFLKVICVGRLMKAKGYEYALKGFSVFIKNGGIGSLTLIGDGDEKNNLMQFVKDNNLSSFVEFKGFISNEEVINELKTSHILVHPSFREGGSWAIMESMFYGNPVICFNTSGPKDMVTKDTGILIDLISPDHSIVDIGRGLLLLQKNKELYNEKSYNSSQRIKNDYNWAKRNYQIKSVYDSVLNV
jgi:glycosyltransferase involved in cell wall biosynthesis